MKNLRVESLETVSLLLLTWTLFSSACFITDCPRRRGKKNAFSENALTSHGSELRQVEIYICNFMIKLKCLNCHKVSYFKILILILQCSLCGPSLGQGNPQSYSQSATFRCFGQNLCCSTDFGCLPPTSAGNSICALEAAAAVNPCRNHVPKCYSVPKGGQCVTEGLCCNSKGIFNVL